MKKKKGKDLLRLSHTSIARNVAKKLVQPAVLGSSKIALNAGSNLVNKADSIGQKAWYTYDCLTASKRIENLQIKKSMLLEVTEAKCENIVDEYYNCENKLLRALANKKIAKLVEKYQLKAKEYDREIEGLTDILCKYENNKLDNLKAPILR